MFSQVEITKHYQNLLDGKILEETFISKTNKEYKAKLLYDLKEKSLKIKLLNKYKTTLSISPKISFFTKNLPYLFLAHSFFPFEDWFLFWFFLNSCAITIVLFSYIY